MRPEGKPTPNARVSLAKTLPVSKGVEVILFVPLFIELIVGVGVEEVLRFIADRGCRGASRGGPPPPVKRAYSNFHRNAILRPSEGVLPDSSAKI